MLTCIKRPCHHHWGIRERVARLAAKQAELNCALDLWLCHPERADVVSAPATEFWRSAAEGEAIAICKKGGTAPQ